MDNALYDAGAVAIILGWVQIIKTVVPESWARILPLFAIVLGIVYGVTVRPGCETSANCAITGLLLGFSAAGAFSGTKNLFQSREV